MYYGLESRKSIRLANVAKQSFEIIPSLDKIHCGGKIIIALPDTQVQGEKVSLARLLPLLSLKELDIVAVELESAAIKRALQYENKAGENCFALFHHDDERSWLCVFLNQQKIFFHEEKVDDVDTAKKRFSKLFEKQYPALTIERYYEDTEWLLSKGLSLWNEKIGQNLLPRASSSPMEKGKLFKYFLKAFFCGMVFVLFVYGILLLLLHFQDEKISAFEAHLPQIEAAEAVGEKLNALQATLKMLASLSEKQAVPSHFLEALNTVMPEGVFLDSLTLKQHQVTMTGRAETKAQTETLLKNINANKAFKQATFTQLTEDEKSPPYHFGFTLTLEVQ